MLIRLSREVAEKTGIVERVVHGVRARQAADLNARVPLANKVWY
jgi:hypothetical protein